MLRPDKDQGVRQSTVLPRILDPDLDRSDVFEIDRSNLVLQLRILLRAMNEGAEEIDMVAIEKVFVESVSRALTRAARRLHLAAEDLHGLLRFVQQAHVPKASHDPTPSHAIDKRIESDPRRPSVPLGCEFLAIAFVRASQ